MFTFFLQRNIFFRLRSEKGSVAIEFVFYFIAICFLCALLMDFSHFFLNKGYLERVSHSLASVLRERSVLYHGRDVLTQDDVDQLDRLASTLLAETRMGTTYQLYVDAVYFQENSKENKKIKSKSDALTARNRKGNTCPKSAFAKDLTKLVPLSPFSSADAVSTSVGHWLPVYQVTLCSEGEDSLFMAVLTSMGFSIGNISVSNAVIPR